MFITMHGPYNIKVINVRRSVTARNNVRLAVAVTVVSYSCVTHDLRAI